MKNVDLHNGILLQECQTKIEKKLALENKYKTAVPLFGAANAAPNAAPNKGTTFLYQFKSPSTVLKNPSVNSIIQGLQGL